MGYTRIYDREMSRLAESGLSASAILVYMALVKYDHLNTGYVYPTIATLEADLGNKYHRSSIEKSLKKLIDSGLILRNKKRSKKRFVLLVRKAAFLQFALDEMCKQNTEKSYLQEPLHVTDPTRNILLENKNNMNMLYLSKPQIEQLGPLIEHEINKGQANEFRHRFLLGIEKKALREKALTERQLKKFLEIEKQHLSAGYSQGQIGSGGKGERIQNESENSPDRSSNYVRGDHPELKPSTWESKKSNGTKYK